MIKSITATASPASLWRLNWVTASSTMILAKCIIATANNRQPDRICRSWRQNVFRQGCPHARNCSLRHMEYTYSEEIMELCNVSRHQPEISIAERFTGSSGRRNKFNLHAPGERKVREQFDDFIRNYARIK